VSNILIVEDNRDLSLIYAKVLRAKGHRVCVATNLTEARQFLNGDIFDLLVCDMNLGPERGLDLIRQYQAVLLDGPTTTIVVSAEEQYRATCEATGIEWFLSKPVSINALTRMVERFAIPQVAGR
jgi:DNA-binding NtrC family response regulator